ncbi:MAG: four helix bundle protein [Candidatus Levybacteria bacterium]|nr:four helix bundle protein [Candidatus Levybacteria bacterium]
MGTKVQGTEVQAMNNKGYHKLLVWQKARALVILIYQMTESFPKSEMFGLISQMRRAAISVVLNIVEGDRRKSRKEFLRFLDMADGSLTELEACLEIAVDLHYLNGEDLEKIDGKRKEVASMMVGLMRSIQKAL